MKNAKLFLLLLSCLTILFVGCDNDDNGPAQYAITLTHDDGGTATASINDINAPTALR